MKSIHALITALSLSLALGYPHVSYAQPLTREFVRYGRTFRLIYEPRNKTGSLTLLNTGDRRDFVLDKCVPNSDSYVQSYVDRGDWIARSDWNYIIWVLCNKGIQSI